MSILVGKICRVGEDIVKVTKVAFSSETEGRCEGITMRRSRTVEFQESHADQLGDYMLPYFEMCKCGHTKWDHVGNPHPVGSKDLFKCFECSCGGYRGLEEEQ